MPAPASRIWLPGRGMTEIAERRVDAAVQEYDQNLRFGRNGDTGQWCIFLLKRGEDALPVLGWDEIPHPEDALKRLYQADALRRGNEILDELNRHNEELQEPGRTKADDAEWQAAEAYEWAFRQMGKGPRTIVPLGGPTRQRGGYS